MTYRFCFGASGSGKSTCLHQEIIQRSMRSMESGDNTQYLVLVPEQYSMQTQKEMIMEHPDHAIMNIDVLSLGRLSHRIFEETAPDRRTVLTDIGKSLLLRRVASSCAKEMQVLGGSLHRTGMIAEVKSVLSEFMQYGIGTEEIDRLIDCAAKGGQKALRARLADLQVLYQAFEQAREDRMITSEETLDLFARAIPRSELIRRSVIVFDGFTGFTPIQYRVLAALMACAREVIFSITLADDGGLRPEELMDGRSAGSREALFYLSRKTVRDIVRIGMEKGIPHGRDLYMDRPVPRRFDTNPALAHLEKNLYRYGRRPYEGDRAESVSLTEAADPRKEIRQVCIRMKELSREKGYCWRDFAVICPDLETYGDLLAGEAVRYDIPVYIDKTKAIYHNPLTEAIRSVLQISMRGFDYESVFRYLRSGLSSLTAEEVDLLENYCLEKGIRGRRKWSLAFDDATEPLRVRFLKEIEPVTGPLQREYGPEPAGPAMAAEPDLSAVPDPAAAPDLSPAPDPTDTEPAAGRRGVLTAGERTEKLYAFLTGRGTEALMKERAERFKEAGDYAREKEYSQIYRGIIELLDEIYELIGEEKISAADYLELLETGLDEIRLGTLPQKVDRVLCGDVERTRFGEVKVLFFVGINDGNIPRSTGGGGLISDLDREFLESSGLELAPSPREQMYIQRLYLYLNMTKATDMLCLSYARVSMDGQSIRPSILISSLQEMFPRLRTRYPEEQDPILQITGRGDAESLLAEQLRRYADGEKEDPQQLAAFLTLYGYCSRLDPEAEQNLIRLTRTAFFRYKPEYLQPRQAATLYGGTVEGSVTRLETAAQCYLRQYLQYGLGLRRRKEFRVDFADTGTVLHESLNTFSHRLKDRGLTWTGFSRDQGRELADQALQDTARRYRDLILYDTARSTHQIGRLRRILERTVETLQYQLQQGSFVPAAYEKGFGGRGGDTISFELADHGMLRLNGQIDRVDLCEEEGRRFVKIIDYKSGSRSLDPEQMRKGLQIQLLLYMNAVLQEQQRLHPGDTVVPSAMLYYRLQDPVVEGTVSEQDFEEERTPEELEAAHEEEQKAIRKKLRPTGMVSGDPASLQRLDHSRSGASEAIPVRFKQDGSPDARSSVYSQQEFEELSEEVRKVICQIAEEILKGNVSAVPAKLPRNKTACEFCPYKNVCGFDPRIPGYDYRD